LIDEIAKKGGNGISNGVGFYNYSKEEALEWKKAYERFSFDINKISLKYAEKTSKI
jgi:3-hydroxybutyryl-CoA dehydrogenase